MTARSRPQMHWFAALVLVFCLPAAAVGCTPPVIEGTPRPALRLMDYRFIELHRAAAGLKCSNIPLVAFDNGTYSVAGFADDPGLYLLVPLLSRSTGLSIARSFDVLLTFLILGSSCAGLLGLWKYGATRSARRVAAVAIAAMTLIELVCGDIYSVSSAIVVATVPWILFSLRAPRFGSMLITIASIGIAAAIASLIRAQAGAAVLVFAVIALSLTRPLSRPAKLTAIAVLLLSSLLPVAGFRFLTARRDVFLAQHSSARTFGDAHPVWHSIYIGLGYWPNRHVARYADEVGFAKGRELAPQAESYSPAYERALRDEVRRIVTTDPLFAARTLALRLIVVVLITMLSSVPGIVVVIAGVVRPGAVFVDGLKRRRGSGKRMLRVLRPGAVFVRAGIFMPFVAALSVSAVPGLLVAPSPKYLLGTIALAALYAPMSVTSSLDAEVLSHGAATDRSPQRELWEGVAR